MVYLGSLATGRDNNLNLIRMGAATAVLVSHAWPIALGAGTAEPLKAQTGYALGTLSVMVFFAISGFLITASFERSSSRTSFVLARVLRLFPALLVNLVFVAFVLAPIVTTLPLSAYLSSGEPYAFVLRNLALFPLIYELPGVFQDQPYRAVVGSIWTLRHEVTCYAGVFVAGILGAWRSMARAGVALGAYAVLWCGLALAGPALPALLSGFMVLSLPFAVGVAFYIWRRWLPMSLAGVIATAVLAWAVADIWVYPVALAVAVGYATFWLAYVPGGRVRAYNRLGDYSYGIYVYAFPLQGAVVWAFGPQTPLENILYAVPPTLILSVASWHLVEAPAMALKARLLARLTGRSWAQSPHR